MKSATRLSGLAGSSAEGGRPAVLRYGIVCDGRQLQAWQSRCLDQLTAVAQLRPEVLFLREAVAAAVQPARGLFRHLDKLAPTSPARVAELPGVFASLPVVQLNGDQHAKVSGPSEWADRIRALQLDFILSFSASSAHELLELATYGLWQYEFGDWQRFRGAPPGFWEVYRHVPVSEAMLVRLTPDPQVVVPLRRGSLTTQQFSYPNNRDQLLSRFTHWPAQVCREILHADGACLQTEPLRSSVSANTVPCNKGVARFVLRMLWYIATRGVRSWLVQDHWNIGIVDQPIADFLHPERRRPIRWLPAPGRGRFIADPFGCVRDGQLTIFCEYLDYQDGVGTIGTLQGASAANPSGEFVMPAPVTIGPTPRVHLSYPQVFEHEGQLLCIPETQGAREVALYALERFPDKWVKIATLLDNTAVVDATLFRHDGLWWLAGATDYDGVGSVESSSAHMGADLRLWYADDIKGPWVAHPCNPVKTDVRSARPAGFPFVADGVLYRPAQDSSKTYGSRVVINRVTLLTKTAFAEEPVAYVEPDANGPYPDGLHTLSAVGDKTLVDGKRLEFTLTEFRRILGRMARRRLRKLTQRLAPAARSSNNERHNSA